MAGNEIAEASVVVLARMPGIKNEIAKALGNAMPEAGRVGGHSFISSAGAVLAGSLLADAAKTGIKKIWDIGAGGGISRALNIEDAQAKLIGLGHSSASVTAIMKSALDSVKGTAFGLGDAAAVAANLTASGIAEGDALTNSLKAVAGTAAISGRSLADVGTIFGSVAARGKLQGDDMLQLMSSGVPVLQMLAKETGKTSAEVSQMVTKGQIDFATFSRAMQAGVGTAAMEAGKTFRGSVMNFQAALSRLFASGAAPMLAFGRDVFNALIPVIDMIGNQLQPVFAKFAAFIAAKTPSVVAAIGAIPEKISGLRQKFTDAFNTSWVGKFIAGLTLTKASVASLGAPLEGMVAVGQRVRNFFATLKVKIPTFDFGTIAAGAGGALAIITPIVFKFSNAFKPITGLITRLLPNFSGLTGIVTKFSSVLKFMTGPIGIVVSLLTAAYATNDQFRTSINGVFVVVGKLIGQLAAQLAPVLGQLAATLFPALGQIIGMVSVAIGDIAAAVMPLISTLVTQLAPVISQLVGSLLPPIISIITALIPAVTMVIGVVAKIVTLIVSALAPVITMIVTAVLPILVAIITTVVEWIGKFISWIAQLATGLSNFATGGWRSAWDGIKQFFAGIINGVKDGFTNAWNTVVLIWNAAAAWFTQIFTAIKTTVTTAITNIITTASNVWTTLTQAWQILSAPLVAFWGAIWESIKAVLAAVFLTIVAIFTGKFDEISGIWTAFTSKINQIWGEFWDVVQSTAQTIWNGITSFLTTTWDAIMGAATATWDTIKSTIISIVDAIRDGITTAIQTAQNIWSSVTGEISNAASSAMSMARDAFDTGMSAVKNAVSSGIENAVTFFRELPGKITSAVGNMGDLLRSAGGDLISGFIRGFTGKIGEAMDRIRKMGSDLVGAAKRALKINSPSRVFMEIGRSTAEGLAIGIDQEAKTAIDRARNLSAGVTDAMSPSSTAPGLRGNAAFTPAGQGRNVTIIQNNPIQRSEIEMIREAHGIALAGV